MSQTLTEVQKFKCPQCKKDKVREKRDGIALGGQIEDVQEFCYLGNVLIMKLEWREP